MVAPPFWIMLQGQQMETMFKFPKQVRVLVPSPSLAVGTPSLPLSAQGHLPFSPILPLPYLLLPLFAAVPGAGKLQSHSCSGPGRLPREPGSARQSHCRQQVSLPVWSP